MRSLLAATIGRFRTSYGNGEPIDPATDGLDIGKFESPKELGALLYENPELTKCFVRSLYRSTLGHRESEGEQPAIDELDASFESSGHRFKELMVALVKNPAFAYVGVPSQESSR